MTDGRFMAALQDVGIPTVHSARAGAYHGPVHRKWIELIPREQWAVFTRVLDEAFYRRVPCAFGGAFAVATYTGKWRNTKDMDLYVLPSDKERMKEAFAGAGLEDYFSVNTYDRSWIFRGHADGIIVDTIWAMANHRTEVDRDWLERGPQVQFGNRSVPVVPPEELIWSKLYVLQKDRSDWPDILNILDATGPFLNWRRLASRLAADAPLLSGVLLVYRWLSPEGAARLPKWIWNLRQSDGADADASAHDRVRLLDSRRWFRPAENEVLNI